MSDIRPAMAPGPGQSSHLALTKELFAPAEAIAALKAEAGVLPSWDLSARQLCDLELLMNGGFAPLNGFLNRGDYDRVLDEMRLESGALWPIPVTLDVNADFAAGLEIGQRIALRDPENVILAILEVQSIWQPDKSREAERVFGTDDKAHPAVRYLHDKAGTHYLGGTVIGLQAPNHYDFREMRQTPNELKALYKQWGGRRSSPSRRAIPAPGASGADPARLAPGRRHLLLHPVVGMTKPGDVDISPACAATRRCCRITRRQSGAKPLGLAMRMGGPREALWHAIIRRNFGCTHFIVAETMRGRAMTARASLLRSILMHRIW